VSDVKKRVPPTRTDAKTLSIARDITASISPSDDPLELVAEPIDESFAVDFLDSVDLTDRTVDALRDELPVNEIHPNDAADLARRAAEHHRLVAAGGDVEAAPPQVLRETSSSAAASRRLRAPRHPFE
jgi:hypothetical protein